MSGEKEFSPKMEQAQGTAPVYVPAHTFIGGPEITTLLFAHLMVDMRQQTLDAQAHARTMNLISARQANNAATVDNLSAINTITSDQTGQTENQQTVSPIRTGTGDTIAASPAGTLNAEDASKIAGAVAGAATASNNVTAQAAALIEGIAKMYGLTVTVTPASGPTS